MKYFTLNYCTTILALTLMMLGNVYGQGTRPTDKLQSLRQAVATQAQNALRTTPTTTPTTSTTIIAPSTVYLAWTTMAVKALDISIGANGAVWRVDTAGTAFRLQNNQWQKMSGSGMATRIAADPSGAAWIVTKNGEIFSFDLSTNAWNKQSGIAQDLGISATGIVWAIGKQGEILKWEGNAWTKIQAGTIVGKRIAVDGQGSAWIVAVSGQIYKYDSNGFAQITGNILAQDIGIGNDIVWIAGSDGFAYFWDDAWKRLGGGSLQNITVTNTGIPWGVTQLKTLYQSNYKQTTISRDEGINKRADMNISEAPSTPASVPTLTPTSTPSKNISITQSGGYVASVKLTYSQKGQTVTAIDQSGLPVGWQKVFTIPGDATQIKLLIRNATGVVWEPWKTVVDRIWDTPTEVCIKVYGTTLDPKSNNECR